MEGPRSRIAAERAGTLRRLAALSEDYAEVLAASLDTNADDEHDPEGATIAFERAQTGALVAAAQAHLVELDAAAERLTRGNYGVCEHCGTPIGAERLDVRPAARLCIACASDHRAR